MNTNRTATATRRRVGAGLTDTKVAAYIGTVARYRLADGTRVRAAIIGRSPMVRSYLHARIVDGEYAGRTVTLGSTITVEV